MNHFRTSVLANAGWLYLDHIVRAAVGLFVFGLVTRSLGAADFGVLAYVIAFPGIFVPVASLGLDYVVVRDFVRYPDERERIYSTAFAVKIGAAALAGAMSVAGAWLTPVEPWVRGLVAVSSVSLLVQPILTLDLYFQSQVAAKFSAIARIATSLGGNTVRGWLAWRGAPVEWFVWLFAGEAVLQGVNFGLAAKFAGLTGLHPWKSFDRLVMQRLMKAAWPLFLADLAIACYLKLDQVLLAHLAGTSTLGRYAAAFRLADYAGFFGLAVINSYFPRIVSTQMSRPELFGADVRRFFFVITWLGLGLAVAVSVGAPFLAPLILGKDFTGVSQVLMILGWANVFALQISVRGKLFMLEGLQVYSLVFFVFGALIHLGLLFLFVPKLGALGAAWAYFWAQFCMAVVLPAAFARSRSAAGLALRSFNPMRAFSYVRPG